MLDRCLTLYIEEYEETHGEPPSIKRFCPAAEVISEMLVLL